MSRIHLLGFYFCGMGCAGGGAGDSATETTGGTQATEATEATGATDTPTAGMDASSNGSGGMSELEFTCPPLPDGAIGGQYDVEVAASGGSPPYQWSAIGLPTGLAIEPGIPGVAQIIGTPTEEGTSAITIEVQDGDGTKVTSDCGTLAIRPPIMVDTAALLAAFPDGCVPLGVGLEELLAKKILAGGDVSATTCELRTGSGMGSDKFDGLTETMPPGIKLDDASCVVSGPISASLPFGIYGFITTFTQAGLDAFVPYCAPQLTKAPTAYAVKREDMGEQATVKPGLQVLDFAANGPIEYGTDVPDPVVTVTDTVGACPNNTCFYAFVFRWDTLSSGQVSLNPSGKFPAQGFDGFTHAIRINDATPSLFTKFAGRPFVVGMQFDYCIADNGDDCGHSQPGTAEGSAMRAALVRANGGSSNYYFSLIVLPTN